MARYGLPYQGSKNKIAKKLIECLPSADTFVDLFAGGCAMTHAAIESGKYKRFIINDISSTSQIFVDAIKGEYDTWTLMPTREQFFALKDVDEAVALLFSFSNNKNTYLYGKSIEEVKNICSNMICAANKKERYAWFKAFIKYLIEEKALPFKDKQLHSVERLKSLEDLQRLLALLNSKNLENFEEIITLSHISYDKVKIPKNTVVYCDPPYRNTAQEGYNCDAFDSKRFDEWLNTVDFPVFVSEYTQPTGTKEIANFNKLNAFSSTKPKMVQEKLFIQERFCEQYQKEINPTPKLNLYEGEGE